MTYRELQTSLKAARQSGLLPASFKLNQTKKALELAYNSLKAEQTATATEKEFNTEVRKVSKELQGLTKVATLTIAHENDDFDVNLTSVTKYCKELSNTYYGGQTIIIVPVTHLKSIETQWMNTNHVTEAYCYLAA
jgi:hypothetical protein